MKPKRIFCKVSEAAKEVVLKTPHYTVPKP